MASRSAIVGDNTEPSGDQTIALDPPADQLDPTRIRSERRRGDQFRLIAEVGRLITSILSVEELLNQAPALILEAFGFYHVHLGIVEGDVVTFQAGHGRWWSESECRICVPDRPRINGGPGICSWVALHGRALVVPDVHNSTIYKVWHPRQKGSGVTAPIAVKGVMIGVLEVESERLDDFDEMDVAVLQSLADQLAVAISNARLYEQAQKLAAAEERQKLARELHDSVSQALYGIALGARTARAQLDRDPGAAVEPLEYVMSLAKAAQTEMRALIFELRPESLEKEGLASALNRQTEALAARYRLEVVGDVCAEPNMSLDMKQAIYRIAQEALHNIAKHAQARHVVLRLRCDANLLLEIEDDGAGFDPNGDFPGHLGLRSMRERATQLGGSLQINSAPGQGTKLTITAPLA